MAQVLQVIASSGLNNGKETLTPDSTSKYNAETYSYLQRMRYSKKTLLAVLALSILGVGVVSADEGIGPASGALSGHVQSLTSPLPQSMVYAYHLGDTSLRKVVSDLEGNFRFDSLPAGLYKVIAFRDGFVPSIALLTRASAQAQQFLDMELQEDSATEPSSENNFWTVRDRIPSDVLRDIETAAAESKADVNNAILDQRLAPRNIETEMHALAGMQEGLEVGNAQMAGGSVGIQGEVNDLYIGLTGNFVELQPTASSQSAASASNGRTQLVSVQVENSDQSAVRVTSLSNRMVSPGTKSAGLSNIGLESHSVSWTQSVGETGQSDFAVYYTEENNFYRQAPIEPIGIPDASRSWRIEGNYSTALTSRTNFETGVRYLDRQTEFFGARPTVGGLVAPLPTERVDVFGKAGVQVSPAIIVEAGFLSSMRDGNLSAISPTGGMVVSLGQNWRAHASGSYQVHNLQLDTIHQGFTPVLFEEHSSACGYSEEYCYQLLVARKGENFDQMSLGFTHRRFDETLHLYFNEDFFNRLESLYLVSGDEIPELQFSASHQFTPMILATLRSSVAAGGGGILLAADRSRYENEVRYLVTSLDTQFRQTSTGVLLAFHHMAQELTPVQQAQGRWRRRAAQPTLVELERLQLLLSQDLVIFGDAISDWAVQLSMEVSRGMPEAVPTVAENDDELRKRITGGVAVKF